ncbi:fungal hydrophobin [Sanghuangporus baumii]|uniref:Hydrophobin n=1 Tax=Sanghuangporus baumii TaxID=108892 RepID=A0A9Q5HUH4_SANBA|nr:fungal hydrophobin [Sanghuangporus baumii]
MYITKLAVVSSLAILAVATPTPQSASQCNTGELQCCDSVQSSSSNAIAALLSILGVVLQGVDVPVGVTCSPITVVGAGSAGCDAAPVCCENNNFNGLISLGCTPININL